MLIMILMVDNNYCYNNCNNYYYILCDFQLLEAYFLLTYCHEEPAFSSSPAGHAAALYSGLLRKLQGNCFRVGIDFCLK